jgi:hypothetical protein
MTKSHTRIIEFRKLQNPDTKIYGQKYATRALINSKTIHLKNPKFEALPEIAHVYDEESGEFRPIDTE